MIWTEFLKSTCKPKKVQKNPTCKPIKPDHPLDHPPAKPAQPTRPPEPINGRLADGLSVNLFSTDGQRISPKPDPPDPNPPLATMHIILHESTHTILLTLAYIVILHLSNFTPFCKKRFSKFCCLCSIRCLKIIK